MKLNEILNVITFLINIDRGEKRSVHKKPFTDVLTKVNLDYFYNQIRKESYDYLTPFLVVYGEEGVPSIEVDQNGIVIVPEEFYKMYSVFYNEVVDDVITKNVIEIKDEVTFDLLHRDPIEHPTMKYPICVVRETTIKIAPKNINYIGMKFYQTPPNPVYAVKVEGSVNVYDEENSVELLWKEPDIIQIIRLVLVDMGFHVNPELIKDAVDEKKK